MDDDDVSSRNESSRSEAESVAPRSARRSLVGIGCLGVLAVVIVSIFIKASYTTSEDSSSVASEDSISVETSTTPPIRAKSSAKRSGAFSIHVDDGIYGPSAKKEVGDATIELAVEGSSAFRVSISYGRVPRQLPSPMIIPKNHKANFTAMDDGNFTSITTSFGSVRVAESGLFELLDATGKKLITSEVLTSHNGHSVHAFLGIPNVAEGPLSVDRQYFGAGFAPGAPLHVTSSYPSVGNTFGAGSWSKAPQFYTPADGYAALVVADHNFSYSYPAGYPVHWKSEENGVSFTVDGAVADIYLMPAADARAFRRHHAELTGAPAVIPRYAFGFIASRWGWTSRHDIEAHIWRFRSGNFPLDAVIADFEWFTDKNDYDLPKEGSPLYKDFSYNPKIFPDPWKQFAAYHNWGIRFGGIRKPRLGNQDHLNNARSWGWLLPGGESGAGRNLNFAIPGVRYWYAAENQKFLDAGMDFWWNDEGEVRYFMFDEWNEAEKIGVARKDPHRRYFSLNRVYTPGLQRYGLAVWTGDVAVSWHALSQQPLALLNLQLMGMPYVACDTGGFKGGDDSPELLTRWYQLSVFMTIMRIHSNQANTPHFPYYSSAAAAAAIRKALELRYQLIPMLYSLGHLAYEDGAPIARPLFMEFESDSHVAAITNQWMLGTGLMAAPVLQAGGERTVYFPAGTTWYSFNTTSTYPASTVKTFHVALDEIPIYCHAGTVLPLGPKIQHTGQLPGGHLEVQVYAGSDGEFTLVEDDGETTGYQHGATRRTVFRWTDASKTLSWTVQGTFSDSSIFTDTKVIVFSPSGKSESKVSTLGDGGSLSFVTKISA